METAALTPRSRFSLLSLLPMLLMVTTLTVAAFELGERLMDYVRSEFGDEAHGRLVVYVKALELNQATGRTSTAGSSTASGDVIRHNTCRQVT